MEAIEKKLIKKLRPQDRFLNSSFVIRNSSFKSARRGSALILVIVLTVLLALIASMFILMSRIDEMSTQSIQYDRQLDAAVDTLVMKIEEELVYDIYPGGSNRSSEAWDYPKHTLNVGDDMLPDTFDDHTYNVTPTGWSRYYGYNDDIWLANLEPEMIDMSVDMDTLTPPGLPVIDYGFRHITDLDGKLAAQFERGYQEYLVSGDFGVSYRDQDGDRMSIRNLRAVILDPDAPIRVGFKADADGDGVADSRWINISNMVTEKGQAIYAAIRIIDNGGMINVNTACRNPELLAAGANWDGSHLSHVNLEGSYISGTDIAASLDASFMLASRYGTVALADPYDYLSDLEYEANAARRLNDPMIVAPDEMFLPFDVGDELELRNRFFLTTTYGKNGTVIRPSLALPATLNPQADPGKGLPYRIGDDPADWYAKVGPDAMGSTNRRHYSTTVSHDVIYRTNTSSSHLSNADATPLNPEQKIGITLPLNIQDGTATTPVTENFIKRLAMGIYRGLPSSSFTIRQRFGPNYDTEKLAWQMAVNMVDYQDDKIDYTGSTPADAPEEPAKIKIGDTTYFGTEDLETLKKNTLCISKIGYINDTSGPAKHCGIEVFNPDDDKTAAGASTKGSKADLSNYKIIVTRNDILQGEFALSGSVKDSGSTDGVDDTIAFLFNDSGLGLSKSVGLLNAVQARSVLVTPTPLITFRAGDKILLINDTYDMPVDCVTVPADMKTGQSDVLDVRFRRTVLPDTKFLLPSTSTGISTWETSTGAFGERLGDVIDPTPDGSTPKAELIAPADSTAPGVKELEFVGVQMYVPNRQLSNLGEIENVFAVGTRYTQTGTRYECTTLIQSIVESLAFTVYAGTGFYDHQQDCEAFDPADPDTGIDMKSFGRIRLTDSKFPNLLDSLTYFDSARDSVDLENVAEGIDIAGIKVSGGSLDSTSDTEDTIVDGLFLQKDTFNPTHEGELYWTDKDVIIEIDVGTVGTPAVAPTVWVAIVQADYNDEYILEALVGTTWQTVMTVANNDPLGIFSGGIQTRPDAEDDGRWQLFDTPVQARKFRIKAVSTSGATEEFSLSEVQLGINIAPSVPYYYDKAIAGRININTAPWYVINQLPWIEDNTPVDTAVSHGALAQAIVAFRDKAATPGGEVSYSDFIDTTVTPAVPVEGRGFTTGISNINEDTGFTNIAQLMQVIQAANNDPTATTPPLVDFDIRKNIFDDADAVEADYTPDTVKDDFEECNLLFHRISNLVTLRSDVFTAYILVRVGSNGPQRRMIAVFDRSEVKSADDKPKLLAIHPVPDPR